MIRVALVADTHADQESRFAEHNHVMGWIATDMADRGVDLALHAGDCWERARTTAQERAAVGGWGQRVTEHCPLVVVAGNHDNHVDIDWLGRLQSKHGIHAFSVPGVIDVAGCSVACLPWPRKANLLAQLDRSVTHEESGQIAQTLLRNVIRGLGMQSENAAGPRILLGHVMIDGALTDHSQPLVGADMNVSLADLALAQADFVACGHVHASTNAWEIDRTPIVYPGAPRHCNFGEAGGGKGYVVATFDRVAGSAAGRWACIGWERIEAPCTPMVLFEASWRAAEARLDITSKAFPHAERVRGAECRLRVSLDSDQREAARAATAELRDRMVADGAVSVKVEVEVRSTVRARAPEVAKGKTVEERLVAMWQSKRPELGGARREGLLGKLGEVRL